jgi:hypothetical protein
MTTLLWILLVLLAAGAGQTDGPGAVLGWSLVLLIALVLRARRKNAVHRGAK